MKMISLLRLGHRPGRDERVTTHCGLVARAFGCSEVIMSGEKDDHVLESLKKVSKNWGGELGVRYEKNWKKIVSDFRAKGGVVVHLTMYGINLPDAIGKIRELGKSKDIMLAVGSQKVPAEMYGLADYNVAVGNTPHSEVAAIALFLDRYFEGRELEKKFPGGRISIIPCDKGKKTVESE